MEKWIQKRNLYLVFAEPVMGHRLDAASINVMTMERKHFCL